MTTEVIQGTSVTNSSTVPAVGYLVVSDPDRLARQVPAVIPTAEAYYWSYAWQKDIRESMAALDAGDYEDFDSDDPSDIVRWMLSADEE